MMRTVPSLILSSFFTSSLVLHHLSLSKVVLNYYICGVKKQTTVLTVYDGHTYKKWTVPKKKNQDSKLRNTIEFAKLLFRCHRVKISTVFIIVFIHSVYARLAFFRSLYMILFTNNYINFISVSLVTEYTLTSCSFL